VGIKPVDRKWLSAFVRLEGKFERTGLELAFNVQMLVLSAGLVAILMYFAVTEYRQSGWTGGVSFLLGIGLVFLALAYFGASRIGLKYVFGHGTVRAFNTWGRLMWSDDLAGLIDVTFFSTRGVNVMRLVWPDRKRSLFLFSSLSDALDTSVERSKKPTARSDNEAPKDDLGPSWICPACHEETPCNMDQCWKCLAHRPPKGK
jgi:hypothetical protein